MIISDKIFVFSHLSRLPDLLHSQDVELRIVAGETIALMYELAREEDEVCNLKSRTVNHDNVIIP